MPFAPRHHRLRTVILLASTALSLPASHAQHSSILHGTVRDPLGALIPNATVELLDADRVVSTTTTNPRGEYSFTLSATGRYRVHVIAATFQPTSTQAEYLKPSESIELNVILATATLAQQVTVTATGTPTPEAQTGAAVNVLTSEDYRFMPEVQDPLRLIPGVQMTQTGETGGTTGLSIRGGDSDANKVLLDGIPATQIGGGVEFANMATVGIQSIEVLNEPNSALFGADAMAGVVNLTSTRAASTPLPLFTYEGDAGNFHTYRNEATASAVYHQFDLYSAFGRLQTSNNLPNSEFHNGTYAGNFGWAPNPANDVRFTLRHVDVSGGQPNAIAFYGIADAAQQKEQDLYVSGAWNNQATPRWHNLVRYGYVRLNGQFNDFAATGIPDPNTGYYDGALVTITGANGYSVSGQALFQYSNGSPSYLEHNGDQSLYAQSDYRFNPHFVALGAFDFEDENGSATYAGTPPSSIQRGNYNYTIQFSGDIKNRLFYTAGAGLEDNGLFGFSGTPRASLAYYLTHTTKLHGTFSKGVKEPSVYQQQTSLYGLLSGVAGGDQLVSQYNVGQLGPEESRTYDAGVDQQLFTGHFRLGLTYFHDEFTNRIEYVPQQGLLQLGVPSANLSPIGEAGGAYLNSSAFRSEGIEFTSELQLSRRVFARASYTYTDAVVQRSFSSNNLGCLPPSDLSGCTFNTSSNFSNLPIGADTPLVGARPFRVAPNTGYFAINYTRPKFFSSLTGTLVSRRDDSDFLSDSNFGNSLLLPNRNLLGGYERVELGGSYQLTPRLNLYTNIQNLLSEHYYEAFGYPALPFTFRSGIKFNFGGESWKLN